MSRYLLVDIGAGTMDILCYDDTSDLHYKAVVKSPVQTVAETAARLPGNLVVTGCEMGGGPVSSVLRQRAKSAKVAMTGAAAATLHHDPERVEAWGIRIVTETEAIELQGRNDYQSLRLGDVNPERLERIISGLGIPFEFDVAAFCAQDHGVAPRGVSHLDFRHQLFTSYLENQPTPERLLFQKNEIPTTMNRLRSIAADAARLPAGEIFVMDSGMAAILGASMDRLCQGSPSFIILDIATSHTVGAALANGEIASFFEYHTRDVTPERLDELIRDLAEGKLSHGSVLAEGGHGAYTRRAIGFDPNGIILATGPRRRLIANSTLPMKFGAPWGDNMMTGTVGLLEAVRRQKSLSPLTYL